MKCLTINPRRIIQLLLITTVAVFILNLISFVPMMKGSRDAPVYMLNMDHEQNIPALYSTVLLWISGILTAFIAGSVEGSKWFRLKWTLASLIFFFFGIDESLCFHERLNGFFLRDFGIMRLGWVLPYAILMIIFAAIYFKFLFELPKKTRRLLILGGGLFLSGALVVEVIGGMTRSNDEEGMLYHTMVAIEETLEMLGSIAFIHAFASYLDEHIPHFRLRISSQSEAS